MVKDLETIEPLFLEDDFKGKTENTRQINGERVRRMNIGERRYYQSKQGIFFTSLTTFLGLVIPKSKILEDWRIAKAVELGSGEVADEYVEATANYGTGLHIATANFAIEKRVQWNDFKFWAYDYLSSHNFGKQSIDLAANELVNDFACMAQFINVHDCKIIAVEIPLFCSKLGIATAIDLIVEMMYKGEKTKALINLKSGKKGFFKNHALQLCGERRLYNTMYGDTYGKIDRVFNLAPTNWIDEPSFKLKDQTEWCDSLETQFDLYNQLAWEQGYLEQPKTKFTLLEGVLEYGDRVIVKKLDTAEMVSYKYNKDK